MSANAVELPRADVPTVMRLLRGLVRRNRRGLLQWIWLVPIGMNIFAKEDVSVGWLMAATMVLTFTMGAQSGMGVGCREHRVLPVTDRDLWVTTWLNTTIVVPLFFLALKLLGLGYVAASSGKIYLSPETLLLSTLYDAVYAGALTTMMPRLPGVGGAIVRRIGRPVFLPSLLIVPLFFIFANAGPLYFARTLPTHVADFSLASTFVLAVGLMLALAGLLTTPPRSNTAYAMWTRAEAAPESSPARRRLGDQLTGVLRIVWSHVVSTSVISVVGYGACLAAGPLFPSRDVADLRFLTGMFLVFAFMGISMFGAWTQWARQLKVLPLSVRQVNALLVFTPIVTWAAVWLIVLLVHAVMGWPINEELSPLAVLAYAGLCAMSHALVLRSMGNTAGQTAASMVGVVAASAMAINLFENPDYLTRLLVLAIGLTSFGIAALINHYTLTRSTSTAMAYRRPRAI